MADPVLELTGGRSQRIRGVGLQSVERHGLVADQWPARSSRRRWSRASLLLIFVLSAPLAGAAALSSVNETPPVPIKQARPKYPKAALERKIEGTVLVEFAIDAHGKVGDARVVESVPELDAAALNCAKKWRFKPATRDGIPVATKARLPFVFRIR
jgi:protein TonB